MTAQSDIVDGLVVWIQGNLDNRLTIDAIADRAGYSKWHLQRIFYQTTRQTLGAYIRDRRLASAADGLKNTGEFMISIAINCGYGSQQSFIRAFKKKYGVTPSEYRGRHYHAT